MSDVWKDEMPSFLDQMIRYLKEEVMHEEGFFRLKGDLDEVENLTKILEKDPSNFNLMGDKGNNVKVIPIKNKHSVTQIFKQFLFNIKNNVIPLEVCQKIRKVNSEFFLF